MNSDLKLFSETRLTAVLFAGGESRRMGKDKATLFINGEPLWARQMRLLRELQPAEIFISARTKPAWLPGDLKMVMDCESSRGPLSGLAAALANCRTSHLLALAVDMPRMTAAHLKFIWSFARQNQGVMTDVGGRFEPLCAIYPALPSVFAAAKTGLSSADVSLQHFARGLLRDSLLRELPIGENDRQLYFNANTPEEFSEAGRGAYNLFPVNRS